MSRPVIRDVNPERGARIARRNDRGYREYLRKEQRRQRGCTSVECRRDFHHGLLRMAKERFIAQSRVMRALVEQVRRFARTDSNVLITGETGTGKNAVGREHAMGNAQTVWTGTSRVLSAFARSFRLRKHFGGPP